MARVVEIGPNEISRALTDAGFFRTMPEFAVLQVKMDTMKANPKKGCRPCKMRHLVNSINADFMHILPTLSDDGKSRIKQYYGADTLKYNKVDRVNRKLVTITI